LTGALSLPACNRGLPLMAFSFHHHKSRVQAKNRILRLLDLHFLREGTNLVLIDNTDPVTF
jgi:hypothetical protein